MSVRLFSSGSVLALGLLGATAANATGVAGTAPALPIIAGYVEAHGGWESGWSTHYDPAADGTDTWSDHMFGGSGRAAIVIAPEWTVQGDVWSDVAVAPDGSDGVDSAIGGHVTWHSANGVAMLGALASLGIGGSDAGTVDNFGVEGVLNANRWRLYGQAGVTEGLSGDASNFGERDVYATLSADYFFNPTLFVSGNIGADRWTQSNGDSSPETSWGAKVGIQARRVSGQLLRCLRGLRLPLELPRRILL